MKDRKKLLIGSLCTLILIMAIGYALLAQRLTITGSTSITSNWQVEITNITEKEKSIGATTNSTNYTATTANFSTKLISPGDYAIYEVTVTNKGTLDAVLVTRPIKTSTNKDAFKYHVLGITKGEKLEKNTSKTFTVKVQYNPNTTTQPNSTTSNITITLNFQQYIGQSPIYEYEVGEIVSFANTDWYVIKNSPVEEDYISLIKAKVFTNTELGTYSLTDCTYVPCKKKDGMLFGSSNDYSTSNVRTFLEQVYLPTIGPENLKEINGYKIRLITAEEIINNLGWTSGLGTAASTEGNNVPSWVYNFGKRANTGSDGYFTMTPKISDEYPQRIWYVRSIDQSNGSLSNDHISYYRYCCFDKGVRPVINLLKTSIE